MNTNPYAKKILFYGDSLVWGKIPGKNERFDSDQRFTGIVQSILGDNYEVIEAGLRARTAYGENKFFENRDGFKHFGPVVGGQLPIDFLVIFLGTNDANTGFDYSSDDIAQNLLKYPTLLKELVDFFQVKYPEIIYICPPIVKDEYLDLGGFKEIFEGAEEKMKNLPIALKKACEEDNYKYFDSNKYVQVSNLDGIHLDINANKVLGEEIVNFILQVFF